MGTVVAVTPLWAPTYPLKASIHDVYKDSFPSINNTDSVTSIVDSLSISILYTLSARSPQGVSGDALPDNGRAPYSRGSNRAGPEILGAQGETRTRGPLTFKSYFQYKLCETLSFLPYNILQHAIGMIMDYYKRIIVRSRFFNYSMKICCLLALSCPSYLRVLQLFLINPTKLTT